MIRKIFLIGAITLLTFTTYSQSKKNSSDEFKTSVTTFDISTDNLDELKSIDWEAVKEAFRTNEKDDLITISVAYNGKNKSTTDLNKEGEDNFKIEISGKSSEIDEQIDNLQRILQKYIEKKKS